MVHKRKLGSFEIQRAIGQGNLGIVYQARDIVHARTVALKTILMPFGIPPRSQESFEQQFLVEARAAARLSHPSIVALYDAGIDSASRTFFLAFELVRGQTLATMLATEEHRDWRESLLAATGVADALHHAHRQGVVHGDVKPANLVVTRSGVTRLMDFGVKSLLAVPQAGGVIPGGPAYRSPEQALGHPTDARTDVFSLGAVLYEWLTNKRAFEAPSAPEILTKLAYETPPPATRLVATLPPSVDAVLARALAKAPEARYADMASLREDLEDILASRPPRHAGQVSRPPAEHATVLGSKSAATRRSTEVDEGGGTARAGSSVAVPLGLPAGKRVSLAICEGARKGEVFTLERPRVLIGRSGGGAFADIELPAPEISRRHALVECFGPRTVLRDLGSTNGTFVGDARITEAELRDTSEFRVGGTRWILMVADQDSSGAP